MHPSYVTFWSRLLLWSTSKADNMSSGLPESYFAIGSFRPEYFMSNTSIKIILPWGVVIDSTTYLFYSL